MSDLVAYLESEQAVRDVESLVSSVTVDDEAIYLDVLDAADLPRAICQMMLACHRVAHLEISP